MIRTNNPTALGVTLAVLVAAALLLDPGLAASLGVTAGGTGGGADDGTAAAGVEQRNISDVPTSNLTGEEGRIFAERLYEGTPEDIRQKRQNHSRAIEIG